MNVRVITKSDPAAAKAALEQSLTFGRTFADAMVTGHHSAARGWHDVTVGPFAPLSLSPAAKVLHYGLEVFEGHKVYAWKNGDVALFRADRNAERLNRSADRLCMPTIPVELQRDATDRLVDIVRDWVPRSDGASLYLRPMIIATEPALGVVPSAEHLYAIVATPVGPYFARGFDSISVVVDGERPRAIRGGVGAAKTGANYAAGIRSKMLAKQAGHDEVMFLDAVEHRFIEELSGMNVFVVERGRKLLTPPTAGTILEGITRLSILELASSLGFEATERPLDIDDVAAGIRSGVVTEMLAVGTAAVVTPIGSLTHRDTTHRLGDGNAGPVAKLLYETLTGIQYGSIPDTRGWMRVVPRTGS